MFVFSTTCERAESSEHSMFGVSYDQKVYENLIYDIHFSLDQKLYLSSFVCECETLKVSVWQSVRVMLTRRVCHAINYL